MNITKEKMILENRINILEQTLNMYKRSSKALKGLNVYIELNTIVEGCIASHNLDYRCHDLMRIKRRVNALRKDPEIKHIISIHNELINKRQQLENIENAMFDEVYDLILIKQM